MAQLIDEWVQRHRWALVGAALALVAVLVLPPRRDVGTQLPDGNLMSSWHLLMLGDHYAYGTARFRRSLDGERRRLLARAAELRFADSVTAEAARGRGLRTADGSVALLHHAGFPADSARALLARLQEELATYPSGSGHAAPVIVSVIPEEEDLQRRREQWGVSGGQVRRFSVADERPACFVVIESRGGGLVQDAPTSPGLDWCALYARYGAPGPAVRARMESRGPWRIEFRTWMTPLLERARDRRWREFWPEGYFESDACVAGSDAMCLRLLESSLVPRELHRGFTAMLLVERDAARFEAYWTSQEDVPTALEQAYGERAAALLREWGIRGQGSRSTGPAALPWARAAGLGWMVVALGLTVLGVGRRQHGA